MTDKSIRIIIHLQQCTSMKELRGSRRSSGGEILPLHEPDAESSRDGVEGGAGTGGAAADDENVERIRLAGGRERRLLRLPGRHDGAGVVHLLPEGLEGGAPSVVAGGDERRVQEEDAAVRAGRGRGDGAEFSEARHVCGATMKSAVRKRWLRLLLFIN